ncbi:unnamed protein product [Auanema sp. JU1783]|nr:unnamed protein product [Auanema sp. JU1783]
MLRYILASAVLAVAVLAKESPDPEVNMTVPQIINRWGYPSEIHYVLTSDDYNLEIHRIPYGKGQSPGGNRPVAFLQHGLECSSSSWVTNLPEFSLAYLLADAGYDVWLGNSRGNLYGMTSPSLDPKKHEFWKFSFDQMIHYDIEASIDYVLQKTNQKQVYYVGHSQGTLIMFGKLASKPSFASKIKQFHALAPIGTVANITGFLRYIADDLYLETEVLLELIGRDQFLPETGFVHTIERKYCYDPFAEEACDNVLFSICGPNSHQLNATRTEVFLVDEPAGTSSQNILHWAQMVRSGKVQMYDYGEKYLNEFHYEGKSTPPLYDYTKIKNVPIYLYWSDYDWLADEADVQNYLLKALNPQWLKQVVKLDDFNHLDFIWGERAAGEVYKPLMQWMKAA